MPVLLREENDNSKQLRTLYKKTIIESNLLKKCVARTVATK